MLTKRQVDFVVLSSGHTYVVDRDVATRSRYDRTSSSTCHREDLRMWLHEALVVAAHVAICSEDKEPLAILHNALINHPASCVLRFSVVAAVVAPSVDDVCSSRKSC